MAVFNPTVPQGQDNMPNWTKVTSPVDSFLGDKSSGITAATIGQGIEGAANALEYDAKEVIKKDVRSTVEPIREDFTNTLAAAKDQLVGASVVPAPAQTAQGGAVSLAPEDQPAPPSAINKGISKVQSIQLAMENGKGVNDTYYDMRLKTAVTDLRTKYPGFLDYIDSEVSKITGINPANDLIKNYMQDINRLMTSKKTAVDTAIDTAMKSGYAYSDVWVKKLQTEGEAAMPAYREWYARQTIFREQIRLQDSIRASNKATKEETAATRAESFTNESNAKLSTHLDAMTTIPGVTTPGKVLDIMADAVANPGKYQDTQMRALSTAVGVQAAKWEAEMRARAREIAKDDQGRSYSYNSDVGPTKIDEVIASGRKSFQLIQDALTKGGPEGMGVAYAQAIHVKAMLDGGQDNLLSSKEMGQYAVNMAAIKQLFGDQWQQLVVTEGLKSEIDKKMGAFLNNTKAEARVGFDASGNPVTIQNHLDRAAQLEAEGKITKGMRSRYTNNMINIVDDIKNPLAPQGAKERAVKYLFGTEEGQGILANLKTDYTDPDTNQRVPGKYSAFTRLTNDDVVREVRKMPSEVQQTYRNYIEREAGKQLFTKEFLNLNHFTGHDNLHFKYNDGGKGGVPNIELLDDSGSLRRSQAGREVKFGQPAEYTKVLQPTYIYQVQKTVDRLNTALAGVSRVEKGFGGNPSEYLLDFMVRKANVDVGKNWEGLSAKLIDAIAASRAPIRRIEDTFDNSIGSKAGGGPR